MFKVMIYTLTAFAIVGCSDRWEGFVYPNRSDLTNHRNLGIFESLEMCRSASRGFLSEINALDSGDYECGKNCQVSNFSSAIKVCEETLR
jgi:hypothetical protein